MTQELLKIILLLSFGQAVTFSLLLLFKQKGDVSANRILAVFLIVMVVPLWNEYVHTLPQSFHMLVLQPKFFYIPFLYGPLLYLYTLSLTKSRKISLLYILLLLVGPVFGSVFITVHFYFYQFSQFTWYILFMLVNVQIGLCLLASWLRLKQHNNDLKQNLSNIEKAKLDWLKSLIYSYGLLLVLGVMLSTSKLFSLASFDLLYFLVSLGDAVFIFFVGFYGLSQPEIYFEDKFIKANGKYDNSSLSKLKRVALINSLNELMHTQELYLDNEISLQSLSKKLNVTSHHLSQALNQQLNKNFYDYINTARVQKAKKMLSDSGFQKVAIIDIAYQVGFNNKTSFNNAFKKQTQLTPSQYRLKLNS